MAALAAARNTPRLGEMIGVNDGPVKTAVKIYKGSLVMADATGYIVPGAAATGCRAAGRANTGSDNFVDTTGLASGDVTIAIDVGIFRWDNGLTTDAITITELYKDVYIIDDHTVGKTDGGGTRSVAGKVEKVDSTGVYVRTGPL
jgi:hypothetical protein